MDLGRVLRPRFVDYQLGPLVLAEVYKLTQQLGLESQQMGRRQCLDTALARKTMSASACALDCDLLWGHEDSYHFTRSYRAERLSILFERDERG